REFRNRKASYLQAFDLCVVDEQSDRRFRIYIIIVVSINRPICPLSPRSLDQNMQTPTAPKTSTLAMRILTLMRNESTTILSV
uniref:Uncharacterized protein n=1 Tax=Romanomermis culicivorax TaxID=13658 RepID=A0A915KSW0_ROMCU